MKQLSDWSFDEVVDESTAMVLKRLIRGDLHDGVCQAVHLATNWSHAKRGEAQDSSVTAPCKTARIPDDAFADEFDEWWASEGQYVRAGGGSYERSFAFEAWRHLYPRTGMGVGQRPADDAGAQAAQELARAARLVCTWLDLAGGLPEAGGESLDVDVRILKEALARFHQHASSTKKEGEAQ